MSQSNCIVTLLKYNKSRKITLLQNQKLQIRAVVVAQLVEQSLSTPEIYGLHPDISKLLSTNCIKEKAKIKKRHREWPIFKKILQIRSSYERTKKCSPPKALRRIHRWIADQQKNTKTRNLVFCGNRFVWMKRRQRHSETKLQSFAFERFINHHQIRDNVRCCCERDSFIATKKQQLWRLGNCSQTTVFEGMSQLNDTLSNSPIHILMVIWLYACDQLSLSHFYHNTTI